MKIHLQLTKNSSVKFNVKNVFSLIEVYGYQVGCILLQTHKTTSGKHSWISPKTLKFWCDSNKTFNSTKSISFIVFHKTLDTRKIRSRKQVFDSFIDSFKTIEELKCP